ncbi:MAG: hypothetical protein ACREDR_04570, partial [Blastocatellia bacterium]
SILSSTSRASARRGAVMVIVCIVAVAPITIRNYIVYRQFVPVQIGAGLNLWTGIGQSSGGERFGAVTYDHAAAEQDAAVYQNGGYATSWYTPDGVMRDHARFQRAVAVIAHHPVWYARSVFERMVHMFNYTTEASLVFRNGDTRLIVAGQKEKKAIEAKLAGGKALNSMERPEVSAGRTLAFAQAISPTRPIVRALQRTAKETAVPFILLGAILAFYFSPRRSAFISIVPLYYLLFQSLIHTEFRYVLPMHYFVFVLASIAWVVLVTLFVRAGRHVIAASRDTVRTLLHAPSLALTPSERGEADSGKLKSASPRGTEKLTGH